MHGQNHRSEEPQLALFATCCPFGPLSLLDLPSRELTFKSKHKMDFSPISMDNRLVLEKFQCQETLWSYYNGILSFVTHSGVIVKLPSTKG